MSRQVAAFVGEVVTNGDDRLSAQRDEPLFAPFALALAVAFIQVDIDGVQVRDLGRAAARGIEQFEQCSIPAPEWVLALRRGQKSFYHVRREHVRNALPEFLTAEQFCQVVLEDPFELQVLEIHPQRDNVPRDTGRCEFQVVEPGDIVGQVGDRQVPHGFALQPFPKPFDVAPIGGDRIRGQAALAGQVVEECIGPAPFGPSGKSRLSGQ